MCFRYSTCVAMHMFEHTCAAHYGAFVWYGVEEQALGVN